MTGPHWKLEDDLETVTVTFPTDPPVAYRMNTEQVDDMLKNLGDFRGHMTPAVAEKLDISGGFGAIDNPAWHTRLEPIECNSLLHIRDPRFGWLSFLIPKLDARKLGNCLIVQADTEPKESKSTETH